VTLGVVAGMRDIDDTKQVQSPNLATGALFDPRGKQTRTSDVDQSHHRDPHSVLRGIAAELRIGLPLPLAEAIGALRQRLDETLSATTISDSTVDHWQSVADSHGRTYRASPPLTFLVDIVQDIAELGTLTDQRLPTAQRRGLCQAVARMAGLLATTLNNLNDFSGARAWLQTAQRAAEENEDPALRAWVLVRHAVSALYWDDPHGALELARQAGRLARHTPCIAAAWAPAVQARAYSRLGHGYIEATRSAICQAEDAYSNIKAQAGEQHAYGYTAAQLHFYRSNALTEIGDTEAAYQAQENALNHYGDTAFLDPSLVRFDRAICLAKDGEIEEAARFAGQSLMSLPQEHRSPVQVQRARQVGAVIPPVRRSVAAVREFEEILAIGASTR
jgi:tetratricopeptide (TPR) repeat protein